VRTSGSPIGCVAYSCLSHFLIALKRQAVNLELMCDEHPKPDPGGEDRVDEARSAYARRRTQRAWRTLAGTQAMRQTSERLSLANAVRGGLRSIADGPTELARTAQRSGKAAEQAADRWPSGASAPTRRWSRPTGLLGPLAARA